MSTPVLPRRVLVADSDEALRARIVGALRQDGYEVADVGSGHELMRLLGRVLENVDPPPALVVAEVEIPAPSGFDVLEWIVAWPFRTAVLLTSASDDHRSFHMARDLGAAGVLRRPFDLAHLRAAVAFVLKPNETTTTQ